VPINAVVGKLVTIGNQLVQLFAGARYWAAKCAQRPGWLGRALWFRLAVSDTIVDVGPDEG